MAGKFYDRPEVSILRTGMGKFHYYRSPVLFGRLERYIAAVALDDQAGHVCAQAQAVFFPK